MESQRFDRIVSSLAETGSRRRVLGVLAASAGIGSLSLLRPDAAEGAEYCLNGSTVTANKKKKKRKLKKQGAIAGACPTSPPPGPPPPPTPNKSLRQDCTPGVDVCPVDLVCANPTKWHTCSGTVAGHANWCCAPEGKFCKDNCDCCQDNPNAAGEWYCDFVNGMTGFCKYQP